ncbi:biotin-dependent carboxyltransferase family protein [uncultured Neptuniibacter sp.]|uniref:5-oxoprolinase subunit C family protein n=1 Tax=uncultured Neptuniibacter sp. TaxID=502143 RepID=UPI0026042A08|nr:biotin-dependent carboxyltransferase family protein [uncultured Neptuniibacter sp.]
MSGLRVIKPGPFSLIQDLGRFGYQHYGVTTGGALDEHAARWANRLLENTADKALLEVTLGNLELQAEHSVWIAITGADCPIQINNESCAGWQTHFLEKGDRITLGWARNGQRAYLAVKGGFSLRPEFGSCSTVVREGLGGIEGKALAVEDLLPCQNSCSDDFICNRGVPYRSIPDYSAPTTLRVISGYQIDNFSQQSRSTFYSTPYKVKVESDRMGYRLEGAGVSAEITGIFSEGIAFGAIQIPPDGQPIIMLKDRQTLGGYPKIGTLLPIDAFRLSQCRPGTEVCFEPISLAEGQEIMRQFYQFFSA